MIKIINGKRYNTDTATYVSGYWNGLSFNDFYYLREQLYLTKSGVWFLEAEGGAASIYSQSSGNHSWGDSRIIPLTEDEAYEWLERNDKVEEIEEYFSSKIVEA